MIIIESYGIGIGKTTLTKTLNKNVEGSRTFFETINHDFLPLFYEDIKNNVRPSHVAFSMQFFLMGDRFFKHIEATEFEWKTGKQTIHDRSIIGDHGFAHKLWKDKFISDLDYRVYVQHREVMERNLLVPQVVIRLEASPETCVKRLTERLQKETGRECETSVTVEYLEGLKSSYDEVVWPWFEKKGAHILRYDWEEFASDEEILSDIARYLPINNGALQR